MSIKEAVLYLLEKELERLLEGANDMHASSFTRDRLEREIEEVKKLAKNIRE